MIFVKHDVQEGYCNTCRAEFGDTCAMNGIRGTAVEFYRWLRWHLSNPILSRSSK
jgi:hypothetical protein